MKNIYILLALSYLIVGVTNCTTDTALTAAHVLEKGIILAKLTNDEATCVKIDNFFDVQKKADVENKIEAVCNAGDIRKIEAGLECLINAAALALKANKEDQKKVEAVFQKCKDNAQKARGKCIKVVDEFFYLLVMKITE